MREREDAQNVPPQRDFVVYCILNINDITISGLQDVLDKRLDLARDPRVRMAMRVRKGRSPIESLQG